ncbi:DNA adenine methylase [Isoptericola sp. b441]|uniref:site-specific DNA-methyltransferase (adenine-specific) n=1 Tax=Actinotalea lenta TaxID=3064654 RepID=A0ABT9D5B4_9CELL|nr:MULTISPECIES: DNA adenine methylase [unclassified Isoptericola]MDO8105962.1 DNA adenine methylase [Isoptericola sp. b441]MDO8122319.1 DNA adenine methylase [Isoptericola sp. b490]
MTTAADLGATARAVALARTARFPRLRYMGSKYRLTGELAAVFEEVGGTSVLDAFSGSGVVSYLLKSQGFSVTSNDYLTFPSIITQATVVNDGTTLNPEDVDLICSPAADDRDFISRTFDGLYYDAADRAFLDSAWSHVATLSGHKRAIAISALVLAAARKQPRGVFTITDQRYDDGRRDLRMTMEEQFRARVADYNAVVFANGQPHRSRTGDVFDVDPSGYDLVYLDPPYTPPTDDNDYIKRYHFLEGLSVYWEGQEIMAHTKTKKLAKRFTPFAYPRTVTDALTRLLDRFQHSTIVLSYSSNAVPDAATITRLLREVKSDVTVHPVTHTYSFGTHVAATRRAVSEYLFVGR